MYYYFILLNGHIEWKYYLPNSITSKCMKDSILPNILAAWLLKIEFAKGRTAARALGQDWYRLHLYVAFIFSLGHSSPQSLLKENDVFCHLNCVVEKMEPRALCELGENRLCLPFPGVEVDAWLDHPRELQVKSRIGSKAVGFCGISRSNESRSKRLKRPSWMRISPFFFPWYFTQCIRNVSVKKIALDFWTSTSFCFPYSSYSLPNETSHWQEVMETWVCLWKGKIELEKQVLKALKIILVTPFSFELLLSTKIKQFQSGSSFF